MSWFAAAFAANLSAGFGLSPTPIPQPAPAVAWRMNGLQPAPASVNDRMVKTVPDLYFATNSHVLRTRERRKLARRSPLEALLYDFRNLVIVIEGHSSDRGLMEFNDRLALERAQEVRRVLLNLSFPEDRLRTAAFAYRLPQCLRQDDACGRDNRRVHFRAALPTGIAAGEKGSSNR